MKSPHILLVDDSEGDITLTLEAFEECRVKTSISIAKNGQEAIDFLLKQGSFQNVKKPDLILMDINMPILSGHEALMKIKNDPKFKKIPVIMLTTSTNKKDVNTAFKNHCNSYIGKPMDINGFTEVVKNIEEFWFKLSTLST